MVVYHLHCLQHKKINIGDKIVKGQSIALLGNSGNSPAPHLHFSVNESAVHLQSDGVPFVFDHFKTKTKEYYQQRQKSGSTVTFK